MNTLDQLKPGERAEIIQIVGHDGVAARLRELGFIPGQWVEFLRVAPLGDPLKCAIQGSRIAVRSGEARRVMIGPAS